MSDMSDIRGKTKNSVKSWAVMPFSDSSLYVRKGGGGYG